MLDKSLLIKLGQQHLLEKIQDDEAKSERLDKCIQQIEQTYPGGLASYIDKAKILLNESATGKNPYEGCKVEVPLAEHMDPLTPRFTELEQIGLKNLDTMVYVLVAGGLGERLGYNGIKVELPVETVTNMTYLEYYCKCIMALDDEARKQNHQFTSSPLLIMTSDDTFTRTKELLEANEYYGLLRSDVIIMKQEKVPALMDIDARLAIEDDGNLIMKPHGHGDVHQLLYADNKVSNFVKQGKKTIFLFQDTNALCFRVLAAALGRHRDEALAMTYICIPRMAKESVGGVCKLRKPDGNSLTINVEYNQLGPLLEAEGQGGDVGDENGLSLYPGNTNIILIDIPRYEEILNKSKGVISEFVNPKYNDDKKTFKSPTRLECMMQDYPRDLDTNDKVGCIIADRYLCFSTLKNNNKDAILKIQQNNTPESAFSAESDLYASNAKMLENAILLSGGQISLPPTQIETYNGVSYPVGARIVIHPSFGLSLTQIIGNLDSRPLLSLEGGSILVIGSGGMTLRTLRLNGYLRIDNSLTTIIDGQFVNKGKCIKHVNENDTSEPISIRLRGYKYVQ